MRHLTFVMRILKKICYNSAFLYYKSYIFNACVLLLTSYPVQSHFYVAKTHEDELFDPIKYTANVLKMDLTI